MASTVKTPAVVPSPTEQYQDVLHQACETAIAYLAQLDSAPVAATADLNTLRARLGKHLGNQSVPPEQVIADLAADVAGGIIGSAGGRFFGWVIGGAVPAAVAADWLTSAWDQNGAVYATSPAEAVVEEVVGAWLKEILHLPKHASYALVSGCQMAHVTCLAAARQAVLTERGWDLEEKGLTGAPEIRILASESRHASVARALRLLGFGRAQVVDLATDAASRVDPKALEAALEQNAGAPMIVVLQAGEINTGSCDFFETLIPVARARNAWVHVDGAFGLWAAASEQHRPMVRGVERADSWATDGHKWLNVPHDCGFAFVAHPEAHRAAMTHRTSYVVYDSDARDEMEWNPEWSRRARGFATYAALRSLGRAGVSDLIERCCRHAKSLGERIGQLPGAELLREPLLNQALVRFPDPRPNATEADHAQRTDAVIAAINATGEACFTASMWKGKRVMRISVSGWQTTEQDVQRVVRAVASVLRS
ncbi:MAG TPA: aminotransferase class V-fold PLP-dependent enzyme [Acidobacteriaceae bacterium]|jgi:glutamate/tyrosine decarboxylase-like PLP-dependent enzyme|nr:aminotransferase class V-fold PLP-dependent enzyme [Acidobacteriaceae bacterium]